MVRAFVSRYFFRLLGVFLLNVLYVLLTVFTFVMIEPFVKLLFRGTLEGLSPVSAFVMDKIAVLVPLDNLSRSMVVIIVCAVLLFFLRNLAAYGSQWVMAHVRSDFLYRLRNRLYDKMISLPLGYFTKQSRGDAVTRAVNDTQEVEYTVLTSIQKFLTDPVALICYLAFLFYIDYQLSLWAVLLMPVAFLIIGFLAHLLKRSSKTYRERLGVLLAHVEETLAGLRVIYGFNAQERAYRKFARLNQEFHQNQKKVYRQSYLANPLSEFLGVTSVMVVLVIGGTLVLSERSGLTAELFITYIALFTQIITPVSNISSAFADFRRGEAAMDRIREFLAIEDNVEDSADALPVEGFTRDIHFHDVSFAYSDANVLTHVDLTVPKGKTVALVGPSGAGKSTLADLLMRFYDVSGGEILLDGVPVSRYRVADYRRLFALVSQDVMLFHDTIYNNITLGCPATMAEVEEAAKVANIYDFVLSLPDGFHHVVGDRGVALSGGQRQRVSIARAVLRKAPVLVLDEATSAMDTESEMLVRQSVEALSKQHTVVMIAHRLSTVQHADCICVLDGGCVVEQGTHEELMARKGAYYQLVISS
ncbi:MAG: ABC transporter ATP-binding protein [Bacteroidales bacterium]|nr:ABC transporter ATP-binding protein [Bacteroidales bacterium]